MGAAARRKAFACAVGALLLTAALSSAISEAGETLSKVRARGSLRCGVSEGIAGFSAPDAAGRWTGLDADFCRAVAAAALGDADKVRFVPLRSSERFPALQGGLIDLLSRETTWTLSREAGLKVQFAGVLFYDGQGFMVPAKSGMKSLAGLKGKTICVEKGTTHEQTLAEVVAARGLKATVLVVDSAMEVADAFFAGKCSAYTSDVSQLASARVRAPGGATAFVILPERVSKEPLAPAVRGGDNAWLTLVRWVLFVLIAAEENGITQASAGAKGGEEKSRQALAADARFGQLLDTDPEWSVRVVSSVGNYGEIFERNLGMRSPLRLERGLNRLWSKGGLMYAPPLR